MRYYPFLTGCVSFGTIVQILLALSVITLNFEWPISTFLVYRPWRLFILLGNGATALALLGIMFVPEGPQFLCGIGKHREALIVLQQMYAVNSGKSITVILTF